MAQTGNEEPEQFPSTVQAAVELVMSRLSDEMREWLRRFNGDELDLRLQLAAGFTPGMSVRALLGLWENQALLAQLPREYQHPDSAASYFLIECRRRLRETVQ
jgi:hypothetical protein